MVSEHRDEHHPLQQIPVAYWLLFAVFVAGLYIFVLMHIDASRARVLEFRFTSETQMMNVASGDGQFKKASPFGKPIRPKKPARTTS
jgi:hypothetical protein